MSLKKILFVGLIGMLLLSGCKIKTPATPTVEPTEVEPVVSPETPGVVVPTEPLPLLGEDGNMACTLYPGLFPELTAEQKEVLSVFPEISDSDWSLGPEDATLTIIEYSDFQCPACAGFYNELEQLLLDYPNDVRLIFRHFPLESLHDKAFLAAQASEAAGMQGKFWEMYHILFGNVSTWTNLSESLFKGWLEEKAGELELDTTQFMDDLNGNKTYQIVSESLKSASTIGLPGTPFVLLNGRPWESSRDYYTLSSIIKIIKNEKNLYTECPPWLLDETKTYTATIQTEKGDIILDLYADEAPLAVNSFIFLAQEGYFDGVTFHRVMHDFVAQAGDPSGTGASSPGYQFRNEIATDLLFDSEGILGMANAGPGTNGSQFFITYTATPDLNGSYTIFGKVTSGMDVLKDLTERNTALDPSLPEGDKIITIIIEAK